jgi:hypothetical protein
VAHENLSFCFALGTHWIFRAANNSSRAGSIWCVSHPLFVYRFSTRACHAQLQHSDSHEIWVQLPDIVFFFSSTASIKRITSTNFTKIVVKFGIQSTLVPVFRPPYAFAVYINRCPQMRGEFPECLPRTAYPPIYICAGHTSH